MFKKYLINEQCVTVDDELHGRLNRLADLFYVQMDYISRPGFDYSTSNHPQEQLMYKQALVAYQFHCDEGLS